MYPPDLTSHNIVFFREDKSREEIFDFLQKIYKKTEFKSSVQDFFKIQQGKLINTNLYLFVVGDFCFPVEDKEFIKFYLLCFLRKNIEHNIKSIFEKTNKKILFYKSLPNLYNKIVKKHNDCKNNFCCDLMFSEFLACLNNLHLNQKLNSSDFLERINYLKSQDKNIFEIEISELAFLNKEEIFFRLLSFIAVKKIFGVDLLDFALYFSEKFKLENQKNPLSVLNFDTIVKTCNDHIFFSILLNWDFKNFIKNGEISFFCDKELNEIFKDVFNLIDNNKNVFLLCDFREKSDLYFYENYNEREMYFLYNKKTLEYVKSTTFSLNDLLFNSEKYLYEFCTGFSDFNTTENEGNKIEKVNDSYVVYNNFSKLQFQFSFRENSFGDISVVVCNDCFVYKTNYLNNCNVFFTDQSFLLHKEFSKNLLNFREENIVYIRMINSKRNNNFDVLDKRKENLRFFCESEDFKEFFFSLKKQKNFSSVFLENCEKFPKKSVTDIVNFLNRQKTDVYLKISDVDFFNDKNFVNLILKRKISFLIFDVKTVDQTEKIISFKNKIFKNLSKKVNKKVKFKNKFETILSKLKYDKTLRLCNEYEMFLRLLDLKFMCRVFVDDVDSINFLKILRESLSKNLFLILDEVGEKGKRNNIKNHLIYFDFVDQNLFVNDKVFYDNYIFNVNFDSFGKEYFLFFRKKDILIFNR